MPQKDMAHKKKLISEIPWEGGDLAPFLHTESAWTITAPQRGKALIGNAGGARNKLEKSTS